MAVMIWPHTLVVAESVTQWLLRLEMETNNNATIMLFAGNHTLSLLQP